MKAERAFQPPMIHPEGLPLMRAAYSDRTALAMARLCDLAYYPFEDDLKGFEELLRQADYTLVKTFTTRVKEGAVQPSALKKVAYGFRMALGLLKGDPDPDRKDWGTQAFIAAHPWFDVLVFRGSSDFADWRTNLTFASEKIDVGLGKVVRVHRGFYRALDQIFHLLADDAQALTPEKSGKLRPLYITGHSLGGALAQIATARLGSDNIAACYTFGAPKVGTDGFDRLVKPPHYRIVNGVDAVPATPPHVTGFRHNGEVKWLKEAGEKPEIIEPDRFFRLMMNLYSGATTWLRLLPWIKDKEKWRFLGKEQHLMPDYIKKLESIADVRAKLEGEAKA